MPKDHPIALFQIFQGTSIVGEAKALFGVQIFFLGKNIGVQLSSTRFVHHSTPASFAHRAGNVSWQPHQARISFNILVVKRHL
jgi:hypothetical protein